MALATSEQANQWLDGIKLKFTDDIDARPEADNAEKVIKGYLFAIYPDLVPLWTSADAPTPEIVNEIASMLMAAYRYAKKYSEQSSRTSNYATWLENKAMAMLTGIANGTIALYDVVPVPDSGVTELFFYPNDDTGIVDEDSAIKFTMNRVL